MQVGSNAGIVGMTKEHLGLALALNVPVFVVVTKIDMCPANILQGKWMLTKELLSAVKCVLACLASVPSNNLPRATLKYPGSHLICLCVLLALIKNTMYCLNKGFLSKNKISALPG